MAGEDAAYLKQLERYQTPEAAGKALQAAQARIKEGFKSEPFPDKGTPEQQAAWRTQNSVPDKADAYLANVGEGIVIGEDDKEIFQSFAEKLHAANLPQSAMNAAAQWYMEWQEERQTAVEDLNRQRITELDDELATKYGPAEYRLSKNNISTALSQFFSEGAVQKMQGAMVGEYGLFNDKEILEGFMQMARTIHPPHLPVGHGNDPGKSIDARLAELDAMRKSNYDAWMKNEPARKEQRELLEAKARIKS